MKERRRETNSEENRKTSDHAPLWENLSMRLIVFLFPCLSSPHFSWHLHAFFSVTLHNWQDNSGERRATLSLCFTPYFSSWLVPCFLPLPIYIALYILVSSLYSFVTCVVFLFFLLIVSLLPFSIAEALYLLLLFLSDCQFLWTLCLSQKIYLSLSLSLCVSVFFSLSLWK